MKRRSFLTSLPALFGLGWLWPKKPTPYTDEEAKLACELLTAWRNDSGVTFRPKPWPARRILDGGNRSGLTNPAAVEFAQSLMKAMERHVDLS